MMMRWMMKMMRILMMRMMRMMIFDWLLLDCWWFFDRFPSGLILEGFWGHLEIKDRVWGSVLVGNRFWRVLEASWGGFWRVLKASWGGFSIYFGIFFSYSFRNGFLYAFEMILDGFWYPLEKQKWAFRMEGIAKIKLSCCLNEVETWLTSEMDFWLIFGHFGDILGRRINQKWTWIATWIEEVLESPWGIDFFECL